MSASGLYTPDEIYRLLPALYRVRDAEQGEFLRELVGVIAAEVNGLAESLEQMYDDQFVETCAEWVAPYIGDLIGYRTLYGVVPRVASPRAEVANTIRYRRRKGTVTMLEQLARDVTGWPARAVEFFELLVASQYMNHVRGHAGATADLRNALRLDLGGQYQAGAFDSFAHTAEMRRVTGGSGRYNIPNVGIFLWRIQAIELVQSPLVAADTTERRYRFDPLGTDQPLFISPRTEEDITHVAEPLDVPLPITRRISAVCAKESKDPAWNPPPSSSRSALRRSVVAAAWRRTWFMYCDATSSSKNSTARAGHPVTSRASCSSIVTVPLRRR